MVLLDSSGPIRRLSYSMARKRQRPRAAKPATLVASDTESEDVDIVLPSPNGSRGGSRASTSALTPVSMAAWRTETASESTTPKSKKQTLLRIHGSSITPISSGPAAVADRVKQGKLVVAGNGKAILWYHKL